MAAAALLARYWPRRGARHDAALAGGLLRGLWESSPDRVETFIRAVCAAADDEELALVDRQALDMGEADVGIGMFRDRERAKSI